MIEKMSELRPDIFEIYSDGACSPNPGRGGYGYVLRYHDPRSDDPQSEIIITGSEAFKTTTNNRMELQGCLSGLEKAMYTLHMHRTFTFEDAERYQSWRFSNPSEIIISEQKNPLPEIYMYVTVSLPFKQINVISDSSYLCRGFEKGWVRAWKQRGWKTSDGSPVKNIDLWQAIDAHLEILKRDYGLKHHFICVPGHRGYKFNEMCDKLAVNARKSI